jgi:hypothetical protein
MARAKKSWREKLRDSKDLPKVVTIEPGSRANWGTGRCLVPAPVDVDAEMRQVRKKSVVTTNELRQILAVKAGADCTCPITTGIFAWIAAHAAQEAEDEGKSKVTPWWRTLKKDGELNPKYPGGIAEQRRRLEAEGHRVVRRGKRSFVEGVEGR